MKHLNGPRGVDDGFGGLVFAESDGTVGWAATKARTAESEAQDRHGARSGRLRAGAVGQQVGHDLRADPGGEPGSGAATLYKIRTGKGFKPIADIAAYQEDPDPYDLEDLRGLQPVGIAALDGGTCWSPMPRATTCCGSRKNGKIETVARIKPRRGQGADGFPPRIPSNPLPPGTPIPAEGVATSVTVGSDGYYYVGELRGFPATPGTSEIWRIKPDSVGRGLRPGEPVHRQVHALRRRLTSIVDLARWSARHHLRHRTRRSRAGSSWSSGGSPGRPDRGSSRGYAARAGEGKLNLPGGVGQTSRQGVRRARSSARPSRVVPAAVSGCAALAEHRGDQCHEGGRGQHVRQHQHDRQPGEVLDEADRALASSAASSQAASWRRVREVAVIRVAITSASETPSSANTASACNWLITSSKPVRAASASPACGPLPVTTVPSTTVAQTATTQTVASARTTGGVCGYGLVRDRRTIATVSVIITIDIRKCADTVHGLSPVGR